MKKFLAIAAIAVAFASCEEKKATDAPATEGTTPTVETPAVTDTTKKADTTAIVAPTATEGASKMEAVKGAVTDAVKEGAAKGTEAVKDAVKEGAEKAVEAVKK